MVQPQQLQKKASSQSTPINQPAAYLQTRPFAANDSEETLINEQVTPDLQAQTQNVSGLTHNFGSLQTQPVGKTVVQPKLTIGKPGDKYEQEADRVAEEVVQRIHAPEVSMAPPEQSVQRQEALEEDELQMKPLGNSIQRVEMPELATNVLQAKTISRKAEEETADSNLEVAINRARTGGQSMDTQIRMKMEGAFAANFKAVKIHTDSQSDILNRSINARAFTTGQDIFFRKGEYNPGTRKGQELLAHELTHVVQQNGSQAANAIQPTNGNLIKRKAQLNSHAMQKQIQKEKNQTQPLAFSDAPMVQPKAKGELSGVVQRGAWNSVKQGAKALGNGIVTGAKAVAKGVGKVIGFAINVGAWVTQALIKSISGGLKIILDIFNLPAVIKGQVNEGFFADLRDRWKEIFNSKLTGGTRAASFFEFLSILAGGVRDVSGTIALVSGLIGLIPGAQPALAVSGMAGAVSFWANVLKTGVDGALLAVLAIANNKGGISEENKERQGRLKKGMAGNIGNLVLGGIAGAGGSLAGGNTAGEAFKGSFFQTGSPAGEVAEQLVGGGLTTVAEGITETAEDNFNEGRVMAQLKKDAWNKVEFLLNPLEQLKNTYNNIKRIFTELAAPLQNFWKWVKNLFSKGEKEKQQDPNKGGQENPQDKQIEQNVNPNKANAAESAATDFVNQVTTISDETIKGWDFVIQELKLFQQKELTTTGSK